MTVADALKEYQDACTLSEGRPPFEDLLGNLIDEGYDKEFKNDSYFDALWLTHHMFNRTNKSIVMLAGTAGGKFAEALKKPFIDALKRMRNTAGNARLILLGGHDLPNSWLKATESDFKDVLTVKTALSARPVGHFVVCDLRMVRVEDPHDDITDESQASIIHAKVNFNDPLTAAIKESFFNKIWAQI